MKKISNKEAAVTVMKTVNDSARKLLADIAKLSSELKELNKFIRTDSEQYESYSNTYHAKNTASELVRLDRKLAGVAPVLKNLSYVKYPEVLFEEEEIEEELEPIDKNPNKRNLSIIATVPKEDPDDGEKA